MIGLDEPAKGLGKRETARLLGLIYSQVSKNKKAFIIAEHDTMFLNYCSYFAELRQMCIRDSHMIMPLWKDISIH